MSATPAARPQRLKTFITCTAVGYVFFLVVWFGLWQVWGDGFWWLTLLNRVAHTFFLPALLLTPLALWHRRLAWLMPIPALLFVYLYAPYFAPRVAPTPAHTVRALTYNVLYSNSESAAVANVIQQSQADLVALQEVQPEMWLALQQQLHSTYPWSHLGAGHPFGTTAIFSRHPIVEARILDLEADRTAVVAQVEIAGQPVTFIAAHLLAYNLQFVALPNIPQVVTELSAAQRRQAAVLADETQRHAGAIILGCDCNAQETSDSYRVLSSVMQNAARVSGWAWGERPPAGSVRENRLERLDYVFFRGPLAPLGVYVLTDAGGSDHQPVLAVFGLE